MAHKVLLTGACGFIGKNTQKLLTNAGFEVHAVTSRKISEDVKTNDRTWHTVNLLDCYEVKKLISFLQPEYLLHLAWDTTPGKYLINHQNLEWVASTLNLCRTFYENGGQRAVFAGTCFEYNLQNEVLSENLTCVPSSLYGICKLALSNIIEKFCVERSFSFAWGRIFYPFGPYENEKRVIPYVIKSLLNGKEALCSHAYSKKDYLYVADVAAALVHLLNIDENGIFNIGSGIAVPLREILSVTAELVGRSDLLRLGAIPETYEAPVIQADMLKLSRTGFLPRYGIKQGLEKTIDWWKSQ